MNNIKKVIIEGNQVKTESDFHQIMKRHFDFGPYYGNNLHAFWDMLSSGELENSHIIWIHSNESKKSLGIIFDYIIRMFSDKRIINYENNFKDDFDIFLE